MKNVGIHVLDFNDNIIDFISQSDGALINVEMSMNVEEKTETFDFTIENTRAEKLRERNRIIAQDNNGTFREFIIIHIIDNFDGTTEIECNASYLEDLKTAKPIKPGKFETHTTTQALLKTLADTGWEVSDDTEYSGNRTTSWTSHTNPFDLIYMLCTTYDMVPSFYIELGAHTVEHRYVSITKPKNLFKGKEITKGKDLTGMTRTIDLSEVKTALLAVGPEKEGGSRIETVVVDDEAQEIFGLPNRYIWDVYEPESNDENMTLKRLTTLAKTELNKRNQAAISYEVSSIDIHKYYNDVTVHLRDIVRVKDRDFRPPLYIEAEVIGIKYNWLADESEFTFGNVIEYEETKLREFFNRKLDEITKKLNDSISNVNTIVSDVVAGELEYYERKIFKGSEPPENPQNDTLWYDTSNPDVAVLRRYWNGEWITQTADDVEKIGGLRREQVMYRDLNNSFINLTIQHSQLQNDVYDVLNSEYLVDDDLKGNLNQALLDVDAVYQEIKTNLDSMDEDTATIGKLIDTQTLFTMYRQKLQTLYKYVTDAKISIDKRLKLLQSQYTDEKFNDAMDKIAQSLPNGHWDSENQQLYADIPNRNEVENIKSTLQEYTDGKINDLNSILDKEIDSKINTTKSEISASISSVERKIDGIEVGGTNLALNSNALYQNSNYLIAEYTLSRPMEVGKTYTITVKGNVENTDGGLAILCDKGRYFISRNTDKISENIYRVTFEAVNDRYITDNIRLYNFPNSTSISADIEWVKLEEGNKGTDWTPAPEDIERAISNSNEEAQKAAQAYADAQDNLQLINAKAYADGIVSDEEQRAIADAIAKRDEAKKYAEQKAQEAQEATNQNTSNKLEPITTKVTTNETKISELDKQISLMAKSDDVAQKLRDVDGRLTPLETTVESNKATLDILPTQIDSKVSKKDYTLDKDNIVQRLNNADSERKQLSNEITDKVTITKFESGIDSVKSTNRNYLQSYYSTTQNSTSGIAKGPYSVALNESQRINFYFYDRYDSSNTPLKQDTDYILKIHESSSDIKVGIFYKKGSYSIVSYTTDKIIRFNTGNKEDILIVAVSQSNNQHIGKISLYEGTKELDWSPAPEDVEILGLTAENNAKSYTDAYKRNNDIAMTKLETSVSQLDGKVSIKVDEQKFNASRKTLSQVISEISATTKGINLSYDENGNIQSYTMDKNGIQLRGDKVDITVNKDFNVMASRVDNKVGKDEVINRLNLSPEGLDINVNNIGIRGGDSKTYLKLSQDTLELAGTFNRTWRGDIQKDNVYMRAQGGLLRFRNNTRDRSLYYSDFGISTYIDGNNEEASGSLQFFDYTYSSARGVTLNSSNGVAAVTSDNNRVILSANLTVNIESNYSIYFRPNRDNRTGNNEFAMYVKLNDSGADTDGVLKYGNVSSDTSQYGSGIRFSKSSVESIIYATNKDGDIGTGDFYGNKIYGALTAKESNAYVLVDGALRITDRKGYNDGKINYRDIQCHDIQAESIRLMSNNNFYVGVSTGELRVTNNLKYNGGNTGYKPVRASAFNNASLEQYKTDIKKWDYDALTVIANDLDLYQFKYKNEEGKEKGLNHRGVVIGRDYKTPDEFIFGDGVNLYEMVTWSLRAIQQLNKKINTLEEKLNEQPITS
ncbi:hypothetical protein HMPREF2715_02670 [Staphylococcus sp. HMSC062A01]|uniref:phage tail spike protein n=1 Tax=Staphylococcus sp. HMSC062A01 TaxID=1715194 RepID=UPI0008A8B745|nr:phage tail spike protein [Staphylococcus sp. HMSC062A01]OHP69128.1 hypothetical protein HMPREF2715_02670 [Staphylococcus sp. HMSC062A01]